MSTQVINLNNVDSVVFGNKEVETLLLNGIEIWSSISQLDKLIDRSIESVSAEDLEGITKIGVYAFSGCTKLTSITIPNSVTSIEKGAFTDCTNLTNITIPNSVTSIGTTAFWNCVGLTSITMPNSVTNIGSSAFNGCTGLTSITIPNSVTNIDIGAFSGCTNLTTMKLLPTTPPTLNSTSMSSATTRIEVPIDSLSDYQTANVWSTYADIMVGV